MDRIPIFPLQSILFPHTDFGIHVFEDRYRTLVAQCLDAGDGFGVVLIRRVREAGSAAEPHNVGTYAQIAAHARLPDGRYLLEVEGTRRFRIDSLNGSALYPQADVQWLPEPIGDFGLARQTGDAVGDLLETYRSRLGLERVVLPASPIARSYVAAAALRIDQPEKQGLLETDAADDRLGREASILHRELADLEQRAPDGPRPASGTRPGAERRSRPDG